MANNLENKDSDKGLDSLLTFLLFPVATFILVGNMAWAAKLTWNLIIPEYFNLPVMTIPVAALLICTVTVFKPSHTQRVEDNRSTKKKRDDMYLSLLSPWLVYVIALMVKLFFY